jgi:hypothetical protein
MTAPASSAKHHGSRLIFPVFRHKKMIIIALVLYVTHSAHPTHSPHLQYYLMLNLRERWGCCNFGEGRQDTVNVGF